MVVGYLLKLIYFLQYSFLLMAILLVESTILSYGYYFREQITAGFHSAMSNGLQQYGREPSLSSVVDDIQSTVSYKIRNSQVTEQNRTRCLKFTEKVSLKQCERSKLGLHFE